MSEAYAQTPAPASESTSPHLSAAGTCLLPAPHGAGGAVRKTSAKPPCFLYHTVESSAALVEEGDTLLLRSCSKTVDSVDRSSKTHRKRLYERDQPVLA